MALEKIDIATLDPKRTIVVATGNAHKLTAVSYTHLTLPTTSRV